MTIRYWVLRGSERWIVYRNGVDIIEGSPSHVQAFLSVVQAFGCIIVYGD